MDKPNNGVIGGGKFGGVKFGLRLRIKNTKVATYIWGQKFLESCQNTFLDKFIKEPGKQDLSLKSGLISVQSGLV